MAPASSSTRPKRSRTSSSTRSRRSTAPEKTEISINVYDLLPVRPPFKHNPHTSNHIHSPAASPPSSGPSAAPSCTPASSSAAANTPTAATTAATPPASTTRNRSSSRPAARSAAVYFKDSLSDPQKRLSRSSKRSQMSISESGIICSRIIAITSRARFVSGLRASRRRGG